MRQKRLRQSSIYRWTEIFMDHNLGFWSEGHLSHLGSLGFWWDLFVLFLFGYSYVAFSPVMSFIMQFKWEFYWHFEPRVFKKTRCLSNIWFILFLNSLVSILFFMLVVLFFSLANTTQYVMKPGRWGNHICKMEVKLKQKNTELLIYELSQKVINRQTSQNNIMMQTITFIYKYNWSTYSSTTDQLLILIK